MTKCTEVRELLAELADEQALFAPQLPPIYATRLERARTFLADSVPACDAREAALVGALKFWLDVAGDSPLVARHPEEWVEHKALLAGTSSAAAALLARVQLWSRVRELVGPPGGELDEAVFACLERIVAQWKEQRLIR